MSFGSKPRHGQRHDGLDRDVGRQGLEFIIWPLPLHGQPAPSRRQQVAGQADKKADFRKGTRTDLCVLSLHFLDSGVVTNRNSIPRDPNGAWYTSGVRIGTPALTSRGFGADEFDTVAELIVDVLKNTQPTAASAGPSKAKYMLAEGTAERVRAASAEMLEANPLYPGLTL